MRPAGDPAAGFWLPEVGSHAEATEWGRRMPRGNVEIREDAGYRAAPRERSEAIQHRPIPMSFPPPG